MRRALPSEKVVLCLTTLLCLGGSLPSAASPGHLAARTGGLISDRRDVIPDPLAGIPEEDDKGRGGRGRSGQGGAQGQHRAQTGDSKGSCRLEIKPESDRAVGDLRAVVAFMQRGPRSVACPTTATPAQIRLRLSIDGTGTITAVERLSGDEKLGEFLVHKLAGQVSESKITSATTGVVQIQSRRGAK